MLKLKIAKFNKVLFGLQMQKNRKHEKVFTRTRTTQQKRSFVFFVLLLVTKHDLEFGMRCTVVEKAVFWVT